MCFNVRLAELLCWEGLSVIKLPKAVPTPNQFSEKITHIVSERQKCKHRLKTPLTFKLILFLNLQCLSWLLEIPLSKSFSISFLILL